MYNKKKLINLIPERRKNMYYHTYFVLYNLFKEQLVVKIYQTKGRHTKK